MVRKLIFDSAVELVKTFVLKFTDVMITHDGLLTNLYGEDTYTTDFNPLLL